MYCNEHNSSIQVHHYSTTLHWLNLTIHFKDYSYFSQWFRGGWKVELTKIAPIIASGRAFQEITCKQSYKKNERDQNQGGSASPIKEAY